jgi:hypothetical protein
MTHANTAAGLPVVMLANSKLRCATPSGKVIRGAGIDILPSLRTIGLTGLAMIPLAANSWVLASIATLGGIWLVLMPGAAAGKRLR